MSSLLLKSGSAQLLTAFLWGTQIPQTPYPRIALSTHMNQIQEGLMTIAAGLLIRDLKLTPIEQNLVVGAHLGIWVFDLMSMCNSFWGTKGLPLLAKAAEATGGKEWQENVVKIISIVFPAALIPAWGIIVYKLCC